MTANRSLPKFSLSPAVVQFAGERDLALEVVQEMVRDSAIVSHPDGNRRYDGYLFRVKGEEVLSMALFVPDVTSPFSTAPPPDGFVPAGDWVTKVCEACGGAGCPQCGKRSK